jgi:hypothetical protein
MRRLILSLSAVSILGMAVGCTHTAGSCDCTDLPAWAKPKAKPEAIKEMPKEAQGPKESTPPKEKAEADPEEPPAGQ